MPWTEFHGIPPNCRQKPYKKAARAPWFQQCRTQASFGSFSFFYDPESEFTLSKNKDFIELFSMFGKDSIGFYLRYAGALVLIAKSFFVIIISVISIAKIILLLSYSFGAGSVI